MNDLFGREIVSAFSRHGPSKRKHLKQQVAARISDFFFLLDQLAIHSENDTQTTHSAHDSHEQLFSPHQHGQEIGQSLLIQRVVCRIVI